MSSERSLSERIRELPAKEQRGSRPRCLLLTEGTEAAVAERLNLLLTPAGYVDPGRHVWAPRGFDAPWEMELDKAVHFLPEELRRDLRQWWLAVDKPVSRLPSWDLLATAEIGGREGIVLVEAKAHAAELSAVGKPPSHPANDARIANNIAEACAGLNSASAGWAITSGSHYQLANRFAWGWRLAQAGVPVVLVYLGFLQADEMVDRGRPILNQSEWVRLMEDYGKGAVPESAWAAPLDIGGTPLIALRRTLRVDLPAR